MATNINIFCKRSYTYLDGNFIDVFFFLLPGLCFFRLANITCLEADD